MKHTYDSSTKDMFETDVTLICLFDTLEVMDM